jgi:pyridoxamine 5'-phosphate oxidase-like protein
MKLDPDMRAVVQAAHLCFAATVTPDRRPNLSPRRSRSFPSSGPSR